VIPVEAPFPSRIVAIRAPRASLGAVLGATAIALFGLAAGVGVVANPIPALVTDFGLRGVARPVPEGKIEQGRCSVHAVLVDCDATLVARAPDGGELRRTVHYLFLDFHIGDFAAEVVADPARPDRLSTDLGLDKLWNRVVTLLMMVPLALLLVTVAILYPGESRRRRRVVRALSGQVLHPVALRLERCTSEEWTVGALPGTPVERTVWKAKGFPLVLDPARGLVLGVATSDGSAAMPLDGALSFVDLTPAERRQLLDWVGPERVAWRPPGYIDRRAVGRAQIRKAAPVVLVVGLVFGLAAGVLASLGGDPTLAWLAAGVCGILLVLALFCFAFGRRA